MTAQHLVVIGRGQLLADTSVEDFIARNSRSFVRIRTPAVDRMRTVLDNAGIAVDPGPDGTIKAAGVTLECVGELIARHRLTVHEISMETASLEEAFMRLTADAVEHRTDSGRASPAGKVA